MDILRRTDTAKLDVSVVDIDAGNLGDVEIRREHKHIDLLIICSDPRLVLVIENKVGTSEHSDQLARYSREIAAEFPHWPILRVYLTADSSEASDDSWITYAYSDLHAVLSRVRRSFASSLGPDVAVFVDHYLHVLETRLMNDPQIDELCRKIYQNHRAAIEMIRERMDLDGTGLLKGLADYLENDPKRHWTFLNRTGRWVKVIPTAWLDLLPPIGVEVTDSRCWMFYEAWNDEQKLRLTLMVGPTTDPERASRSKLVRALTDPARGLGLKTRTKNALTAKWSRLGSVKAYTWSEDDAPDEDEATKAAVAEFEKLATHTEAIGRILAELKLT